jgi:hypothetical protein
MRRRARLTTVALISGAVLALASCDKTPIRPSPLPTAEPPRVIPAPGPQSGTVKTYTLTLTSRDTAAPCSRVPEALRRRVYMADVQQTGVDLKVVLTGADFMSNTFYGVIKSDDEISFTIRPAQPWDYDAFDVVERLSDGTLLIVSGVITAKTTSAGIFGTGGEIRPNTPSNWCSIDAFEMVPRSGPWDY